MKWTREQFQASARPDKETVSVPGLAKPGEEAPEMTITGVSGAMRQKILEAILRYQDQQVEQVIAVVSDWPQIILECALMPETGERIFENTEQTSCLSLEAQQFIAQKALDLSKIGAKASDELAKNSSSTPSEPSSSTSLTAGGAQ
jgi:hypothetical protein